MCKRLVSLAVVFILVFQSIGLTGILADGEDFVVDISAADEVTFGESTEVTLTVNGIAEGTSLIGFDVYEISYDEEVLKADISKATVSLEGWEVSASDLTEKYGYGYIRLMINVSALDIDAHKVSENGKLQVTIPFEAIGVKEKATEIKINPQDINGVNSSYEMVYGTAGEDTASIVTLKAKGQKAQAPEVLKAEHNSITLNEAEGCEYSIDGESWQESSVFEGLDEDTEYTFYQRFAETETTEAGETSESISAYTRLDMSQRIYGMLGAQIRTNETKYDIRFIANLDRVMTHEILCDVESFGFIMAREDQLGDDDLTLELLETADYTVMDVPINYFSTSYATEETYTFSVRILAISDYSRKYVVRPYFVLRGNAYYADAISRCVNDGLK